MLRRSMVERCGLPALWMMLVCAMACQKPSPDPRPDVAETLPQSQDPGPGDDAENDLAGALPGAGQVAPDQPLTVERSWCSKAQCPLTLTFNHPMVTSRRKGLGDAVAVTFAPHQPGSFHWTSSKELVFKPAPRAMAWGHPIEVTVSRARALDGARLARPWSESFTVPYFSAAGKVASWPVIAGRPRLVAFLNGRDGAIGAGPLYLLYDQPVPPARVAAALRLSHDGRSLPVKASRPRSIAHVHDGEVDTRLIVAVKSSTLPPHGSTVTLQYPKLLDGRVPEVGSRELEVRTDFSLTSMKIDGGDPDKRSEPVSESPVFVLAFNNPVSSRTLEDAVSITPKPKNLRVSWIWGTEAYVHASLEPGQRYRLTLAPGLRDELGNRLGEKHVMAVTVHDRAATLTLPGQPLVLERGHARVPFHAMNTAAVRARFHPIESPARFIAALRGGEDGCAPAATSPSGARTWNVATKRLARNAEHRLHAAIDAGDAAGDDPGARDRASRSLGLGCVALSARSTGSRDAGETLTTTLPIQVSNLGVTAKVHAQGMTAWVTRLSDAEPQAGARVRLFDAQGTILATATSDRDGLTRLPSTAITRRGGVKSTGYLVVDREGDTVVAEIGENRLSQPWHFSLRGDVADSARLDAAVFTERGVYRPKETVHMKIIARDGGRDYAAERGRVTVTVTDPRGSEVTRRRLALDAFGGADLDVALAENAGVGAYRIDVAMGQRMTQETFRVEEYRVPTFEVEVSSSPSWTPENPAQATIAARYLHGGDLAGRTARYTVSREPARFAPAGFAGYVFGQQAGDPSSASSAPLAGVVNKGEARLDGRGEMRVDVEARHPVRAGPMRYVVDASVTDVDRQVYAGRLARVVHPTPFYIGVRPAPARVLAAGDRLTVPVVAVATDGATRPGVPVTVELHRIDHHTSARLEGKNAVQLENRPVSKRVARCAVRTTRRAVSCRLRIPTSGQYQVIASAATGARATARAARRAASSARTETSYGFHAGGSHTVAWPRFEHERIDVIADKARYRPGDTARLMIASPFRHARGLLTLERDGVIEHRLFRIAGDTPVIEIPITEKHAPNLYASVTLVQPRRHDERDATGFETGAPAFRMGYVELGVEPRDHALDVAVTSARTAHPRGKLDVAIAARDAGGAPVAGRAVVMVVDEAVLGMTGYRTPDPLAEIVASRPLGVRTVASLLDLPHSRRARHEQIFVAGDGGAGFGLDPFAPELRTLFQSTAYWNPSVVIDAQGQARLSIDLPDNVTTYRVMAVVTSAKAHFGSAQHKVMVRKPLMVKPILPRFVYPGDTLTVEAQLFNGTDDIGRVEVVASFTGLEPVGDGAKTTRTIDVQAGKSSKVGFPVRVTGRGQARVRVAARIGRWHRDAVELEVPILEPGVRRTQVVRQSIPGNTAAGAAHELVLDLPGDRVPGSETVEVVVSRTRLTQLRESVEYLMGYPHGCIEQTTSRAYPLLVLGDLLPEMGVTVSAEELRKFAEAGVKRLISFQTSAGGLAYWPGSDDAHAFGTAFGGAALIEAKKRGFDVPDEVMKRMADYLEASLRKGTISEEMPHGGMPDGDTRALFVMTLGRMDRPQPAYVATLWRKRDKLSAFGAAFLAVAASELASPDRGLIDAMLAEVRSKAKEAATEAYYEGQPDGGWSMGSPLRTHATALLAFSQAAPGDGMKGKLLSGLLERQRGGLWGNTQENVFGIMAVAQAIRTSSASGGPARRGTGSAQGPGIDLSVNGVAHAGFEKVGENRHRAQLAAGQIRGLAGKDARQTIAVSNRTTSPMFVSARADYDLALNRRTMAPRDDGFSVERFYETVNGSALDPRRIPIGSLVRVRLRVTSAQVHNYVAIQDKLPAGLEALNANLATTETVALGALSDDAKRGLAVLSHTEIRDERVAFYADSLPAGTYEMIYLARATTPGRFLRPAASAEAMYQPEKSGASAIDHVVIR